MSTYIPYHMHTDCSLLDSCTKPQEYIDLAVRDGVKALSFSEHGKPLNWVSKKLACDKAGIKYIHSVEIYLTENPYEKVRDNYHTVLMAKNYDGVLELNRAVSKSCDRDHFYYTNRLSFDEFLGLSENIIATSACLASPLNKLDRRNPYYDKLVKRYDFLEIQPHSHPDQVTFNRMLFELSKDFGKPLIAGTDTHSSSQYKAECRSVLLSAKHKSYGDEDLFDLSYKTSDELVEMFRKQESLPDSVWMSAIENTNQLLELCEDFSLDRSIKYPILYGSREADNDKFADVVEEKFKDKVEKGIITSEQEQPFRDAIDEEMRVFTKLKMSGFMLSMSELVSWCKDNGMAIGPARGSVGGSRVAYVTDIIDLNPETWHTVFSRFANEDREEIGDIDIDCVESDRPAIFKYIVGRFGIDNTARVASFGTIKAKGVIDDVGRHLAMKYVDTHTDATNNPWSLANVARIKDEFDKDEELTKQKYPELFYYFDGLLGTKISQSVHPAGMIISPIGLAETYGTFDKENENCLMIDMEEAHEVGLAKYDFLILKTVQVIRDACNYIGIKYPKSHEINWNDKEVWEDMRKDLTAIFQFESAFAADSFKKFKTDSIFDMSLVTACIRPTGASYRDELLVRKPHQNPSPIIDKLLENNLGYLVYQEDTIAFLQQICGLSGSSADNIRRAIGRKQKDRLDAAMPSILEGYCERSDQPRDKAEEEAKEFLQVIEDSASYQFGYNHSIAYCLLGYLCGYYRYHYPLEFITSFLNNAANDDDIKNGTKYASKCGIMVTNPKWGISKREYYFDKERNTIAKGVSSIKYMSAQLADELYELATSRRYTRFTDVLIDLDEKSSINTRQLDILIKIDFFSEFGNQRELLRITEMFYGMFKRGQVKQINKADVDGTQIGEIVQRYSVGITKSGGEAKRYTVLDVQSIMYEVEDKIKSVGMQDLSDIIKVQNFYDAMGYIGYSSGKEEDRRKLYILDVFPVVRRKDNKQFGYSVVTKSIGSGKESRFTVLNNLYNRTPVQKGNIIYCKKYESNGGYFRLTDYEKIV